MVCSGDGMCECVQSNDATEVKRDGCKRWRVRVVRVKTVGVRAYLGDTLPVLTSEENSPCNAARVLALQEK